MTVHTLITVTDRRYLANCTLVLKSFRTGFPTADIAIWVNSGTNATEILELSGKEPGCKDAVLIPLGSTLHHAEWIRKVINGHNGHDPLVIVDPDVHFWKSCEDWRFNSLMAGFHVPEMFNDWAQCKSFERLHTSFLWFKDTNALKHKIHDAYPWANKTQGEYCPCDPFMPSVKFIRGEPVFWDTCAVLYNMIGGEAFTPEHLACYEHLNSAGFVQTITDRMGGKTGQDFRLFHELAPLNMEFVRQFSWSLTDKYYRKKALEAQLTKPK